MDTSWLSSQVAVAVVVGVFAVVGAAFFFLSEPGRDAPPADPAGDVPDPGDADTVASAFETEPCWVSLLPRRGAGPNADRGGAD